VAICVPYARYTRRAQPRRGEAGEKSSSDEELLARDDKRDDFLVHDRPRSDFVYPGQVEAFPESGETGDNKMNTPAHDFIRLREPRPGTDLGDGRTGVEGDHFAC
jgi:hypothetical protein